MACCPVGATGISGRTSCPLPGAGHLEGVSLWPHAHRNDRAIVTMRLEWDKLTLRPIDDRTQRLEVPFPNDVGEDARSSFASALVGLEVVGGPIEVAKLSRSHVWMEITRDADIEAIERRVQALANDIPAPADGGETN